MTIMTKDGARTWWGIEPPKEVAYWTKNDMPNSPWMPTTYKEIFTRKKARQDSHIYEKRRHEQIKPCAVWVFWDKPLWGMFFGGWRLYVRTLKGDYPLNFRCPRWDLVMQVKQLFSCGCLPFNDNYDPVWFAAFEKKYHYTGKRKKNAIAFCHFRFDGMGCLVEIIK